MRGAELGAEPGEVRGGHRGPGPPLDDGRAFQHAGAQGLGEASGGLADAALHELDC